MSSCRMAPTSPSATPSMEARPSQQLSGGHTCVDHVISMSPIKDRQSRPRPQAGRHGGRPPAAAICERRLLATHTPAHYL